MRLDLGKGIEGNWYSTGTSVTLRVRLYDQLCPQCTIFDKGKGGFNYFDREDFGRRLTRNCGYLAGHIYGFVRDYNET